MLLSRPDCRILRAFFFFQAEDGIRDGHVTGVQTCALPISAKVKALVNMVMNINTAGLAEGLALGSALGLDLEMLRKMFSQTGAASRVLETDGEDMQNRDHSCFFSAAHAAKDSGIALELGRSLGLDLP